MLIVTERGVSREMLEIAPPGSGFFPARSAPSGGTNRLRLPVALKGKGLRRRKYDRLSLFGLANETS
jgi:hypothetical protein